MGLQDLAAALRPVCAEDEAEWSVLVDQAGSGGAGQLVWYASSGLDLYPFTATCCGYPLPSPVQSRLSSPVLVMSDYSTNYLETLREAYAALDDGPVLALEPGRFGQALSDNEVETSMIGRSQWAEQAVCLQCSGFLGGRCRKPVQG